jgi:hypothetical protein
LVSSAKWNLDGRTKFGVLASHSVLDLCDTLIVKVVYKYALHPNETLLRYLEINNELLHDILPADKSLNKDV